jgi:hypothetical protein
MPAKKKAAPKAVETEAPKETKRQRVDRDTAEQIAIYRAEREREAALRDAREAALIEQPKKVSPDAHGDIDQRMAALLKDHKDMGVRS